MSSDGSVSRWLQGFRVGDDADIERLWDRDFHRLVALARVRLARNDRRACAGICVLEDDARPSLTAGLSRSIDSHRVSDDRQRRQ